MWRTASEIVNEMIKNQTQKNSEQIPAKWVKNGNGEQDIINAQHVERVSYSYLFIT